MLKRFKLVKIFLIVIFSFVLLLFLGHQGKELTLKRIEEESGKNFDGRLLKTKLGRLCFKYYGLSKVPIENGKNCKTLLYMKTRTGGYFEYFHSMTLVVVLLNYKQFYCNEHAITPLTQLY